MTPLMHQLSVAAVQLKEAGAGHQNNHSHSGLQYWSERSVKWSVEMTIGFERGQTMTCQEQSVQEDEHLSVSLLWNISL